MSGYDAFAKETLDNVYILSLPGFRWLKANVTSGSTRAFTAATSSATGR